MTLTLYHLRVSVCVGGGVFSIFLLRGAAETITSVVPFI